MEKVIYQEWMKPFINLLDKFETIKEEDDLLWGYAATRCTEPLVFQGETMACPGDIVLFTYDGTATADTEYYHVITSQALVHTTLGEHEHIKTYGVMLPYKNGIATIFFVASIQD